VEQVILSIVEGGSIEAQWAMTQYFEELARRFPGGFDPGGALDEAAVRYNAPTGLFIIARIADETVGCGALDFLDDTSAEIKRMWISARIRGIGLGKRLLAHLEDEARRAGRSRVILDTNGALKEAIAMYETSGYSPTTRYNDNPYAERWFTKTVGELERR
jgi:GNAT superfamily N-acetyltransferase